MLMNPLIKDIDTLKIVSIHVIGSVDNLTFVYDQFGRVLRFHRRFCFSFRVLFDR